MREAINNSLKRLKEKPSTLEEVILVIIYFIFLSLSISNNNLFLKELTLCGLIILFALMGAQAKNKY
ncbi:hypothetical protein E1J38_005015 [Seonamhaeicola sediminis]|uniref:Uncharacterized protein n=1 Tax=Seonamhaeicola sediminis TaxID=2528206 RepID=A0A562YF34_9FLAO|nr:hypothetical protein [Seonamhaeicola sediminis]TWO33259.1 hypothetical protein E1J38_005015 [Seonamhaeicola sediminis]